jgi:uncharacterized protein (DUF2235 family)
MKNIVICFDGTWNTADEEFPTNVVKTAQLVLPVDARGVTQIVFYDQGVGSMQVAFGSAINNFLGGAFGVGLMDNIESAYRFLTLNYAPEDRIFIFGFSRGAFSARSFGGLIRTCGILRKEHVGQVRKAVKLYKNRDREDGADAEPCMKFRRDYAVASFSGDAGSIPNQHPLTVEYIGIWDTVGALGIPAHLIFANSFNQRYQFHDLALSRMVKSARHAVSIDERRRAFAPTLWENVSELNAGAGESTSQTLPYQQVWFPGDHASVGGGGDVNGLWQAALVWVVEGAQLKGLTVNDDDLQQYRADIKYTASVYCMKKRSFGWSSLLSRRWRIGPRGDSFADVSELGRQRIKAPAAELFERKRYRPRTLRAFIEKRAKELETTWR